MELVRLKPFERGGTPSPVTVCGLASAAVA
jgi:hypothetical protein